MQQTIVAIGSRRIKTSFGYGQLLTDNDDSHEFYAG